MSKLKEIIEHIARELDAVNEKIGQAGMMDRRDTLRDVLVWIEET